MNIRQYIRAIITAIMMLIIVIVIFVIHYDNVYLDVLKELSLPLTIILGGYFSVEAVKNIKK